MSNVILDALVQVSQRRLNQPALLALQRADLTYSRLGAQIMDVRSTLERLGVHEGDRIAIVLPNGSELAVACLSVLCTATAVPVNPDYKLPEYEMVFERIRPVLLITLPSKDHPAVLAAQKNHVPVLQLIANHDAPAGVFTLETMVGFDSIIRKNGPLGEAGEALLLMTSGTTAAPKVVPITRESLLASARNIVDSLSLSPNDRCLHFLPSFHIGGIVDVLLAPLVSGGQVFCAQSFSGPDFFRDLRAFSPTWTQAVPIMLMEILESVGKSPNLIEGHSLRFVRSVSAPLSQSLLEEFEQVCKVPIIEIYGMTETAGVITSNPLPPALRKSGSVGLPINQEVKIVPIASENIENSQRVIGEVVVRGVNVTVGYDSMPEINAVIFQDGWFRTGDLGYFDNDGYLYLTGRIKELINRGGEKVSPYEVDQALLAHPAVLDAAAFGIPHTLLNEDVAALVVLKEASCLSRDELLAWLRDRLAFFKIPRVLHFVGAISRGKNGKLQRAHLAELYARNWSVSDVDRPAFVPPQTPVAKALAAMWIEILTCDQVGMDDDFFALGGDSLKAASFINVLQQKWGDTIYVSSLFDAPTLAKYERYLRLHYPEMVAKMLGQYVAPKEALLERVTPVMVRQLQGMLAKPLGALPKISAKNKRAVFVLSPPRSGSTLLRAMLAGHPQLFAPPELYLLSYETLADRKHWFSGSHRSQLEGNIRALMQVLEKSAEECLDLMADLESHFCSTQEYYRMLQEWLGERILVDKTPAYAVDPSALARAEAYFDEPVYIHLLRHPYGMIRSFEEAKLDQLWFPRLVGTDAHSLDSFPFTRRQLAEMIWLLLHQNILDFLKQIPAGRQFQLRFEEMVSRPEAVMSEVCSHLDLPFAPEMLNPQGNKKQRMTDGIHEVSRMIGDPKFHQHKKIDADVAEQWKSAYDLDFLSDEASNLARLLGYEETVASAKGRVEFEF